MVSQASTPHHHHVIKYKIINSPGSKSVRTQRRTEHPGARANQRIQHTTFHSLCTRAPGAAVFKSRAIFAFPVAALRGWLAGWRVHTSRPRTSRYRIPFATPCGPMSLPLLLPLLLLYAWACASASGRRHRAGASVPLHSRE